MAIMAMATVRKIKAFHTVNLMALLSCFTFSSWVIADELKFVPNFGLEETYTDNVELTIEDPISSLVSQAILGLDIDYESRLANFSFTGTNSNLFYSHDSEINDSYFALNSSAEYYLWTSGPQLVASATIDNTSRNSASNGLADLVSGDTVRSENYNSGFRYNVINSTFSINTSLIYTINRYEDNIGNYNGVNFNFRTSNSNNARLIFWQLNSKFSTRSQDFSGETRSGEQFSVDARLGSSTPFDLNPFIRFYDENYSGDLNEQSQPTTSSWGPGLRWLVSEHLQVDLSYNYVTDDSVSDDYVATSLLWEPSARTSLTAGYSQRFFGDSYNLKLRHRTKRFTNSISYDESLEVFDRNNYEQIDTGIFWCPPNTIIDNISQCFTQSDQTPSSEFQLVNFFYLEPVESNEFSLNKRFSWNSSLQLARTSFALNALGTRREGLDTKVIDDNLSASFTIERRVSGKSKLTFLAKYDYLIFDKNNPAGSRQEDYYRTISATYTKDLASSLSGHVTFQHVNRDSNIDQYSYDEIRAIINITKDF